MIESFILDPTEKELNDFMPMLNLTKKEGKRPGIFFRFRPPNPYYGKVRVYPGKLK